jgi:hypothetical protein
MNGFTTEFHATSWGPMSNDFMGLREVAYKQDTSQDDLEKALTTGDGIIQQGDTGGRALRVQFLHKQLEQVSFDQEDAVVMRLIPKKKVPSNTVEWTEFLSYGTDGDAFVGETGSDGAFGVSGSDDNFARQVQKVRYMATQRTVSLVSQLVNNIEAPMKVSEKAATLELVAKMNTAVYNADSTLSNNQFNGLKAQIKQWVNQYPQDSGILWDAAGQPIGKEMLNDMMASLRLKYGKPTLLIMSVQALADLQKALYPNARYTEGISPEAMGIDTRAFKGPNGKIRFEDDPMLRANEPITVDGIGSDGKPRTATTASSNALTFVSNPFVAASGGNGAQALAPGTGNYYNNVNYNTDITTMGTVPSLPTKAKGGNAGNRLPTGTHYYAVSAVYGGRESVAWVLGASAAGTVTGAAALTVTSGNSVVQIDLDLTTPCITGLGSTYSRNLVKFRVYRCLNTAPGSLADFDFLCDIGCPTSGNARGYDNGMYIAGYDQAFMITESKHGSPGWFLAQLLPLMKRPLPHLAMADLFALLAFVTPILWVPRHHLYIRNIGPSY